MPTIEELKQRMITLRREHEDAQGQYHNALIDAYPFKPGDIIRSSKGTIAQVRQVGIVYDKVRLFAVLKRKDGNFGKTKAPMWRAEWDTPELVKE